MPIDEIKDEICEHLSKAMKEIEKSGLANEDFEIEIQFGDGEIYMWNLTYWDRID
jgi:hypothetical protein